MDVYLVNMPYAEIRIPSLALGLLHGALEREGFSVTSVYANVRFADDVGVFDYGHLWARARPEEAIAEWSFAHIAFPEHETDPDAYGELLRQRHWLFGQKPREWLADKLRSVREIASRFIERLSDDILSGEPHIVGCTSTFCQHVASLALLRRVRERDSRVVTMLGGANCETIMGMTTHRLFPWVDFVVSGEADGLIAGLCRDIRTEGRDLDEKHLPVGAFAPIHRNIGYPRSGQASNNGIPRAVCESFSNQPPPNYDDYFKTLKISRSVGAVIKPGLIMEASRGCWWGQREGCTFCGLNGCGKQYRAKSPDAVLGELKTLSARYGVNRFEMVDNVFGLGFVTTLLPQLRDSQAPYHLFFEVRANVKRRHVRALREAGVIWIQAGIESLDSHVLKLTNKGCQAWQNLQLLKWCGQFGMRCVWNILYDFPGERDAWYEQMASFLPLLTHLQPPSTLIPVRYDRFSHYHSRAGEYGLRLVPPETYQHVYPVSGPDLADLVYFFDEEERLRIKNNPILSYLLVRPGASKVMRRCEQWRASYFSDPQPTLVMRCTPEGLNIRDTRSEASQWDVVLSGLASELYRACDEAPTVTALMESFERCGNDRKEIEDVIAALLDKKLMVCVDGRYVALALWDPVPELPKATDFPGGYVYYEKCVPRTGDRDGSGNSRSATSLSAGKTICDGK